ncbi:MAG: tetratricopeptide repeat protein, partial [Kiritimatiellales bacterium]
REGRGIEKNAAQAVYWFRKSAESGNADAQLDLGFCCEKGRGVRKDMQKAVEWYEKSAAQGNLMALNNLGLCYQDGKGVEKNYEKAVELYRKALDIDPDHARTLNSYAWLMLTSDDESFHNYPEAVQMAERSVGLDEQGFSLDTLAVAYFKNGQFDKAVDTQERLIDFRKRRGPNEAVPERMMKRLEEYETKRVEAEDRGSAGELL